MSVLTLKSQVEIWLETLVWLEIQGWLKGWRFSLSALMSLSPLLLLGTLLSSTAVFLPLLLPCFYIFPPLSLSFSQALLSPLLISITPGTVAPLLFCSLFCKNSTKQLKLYIHILILLWIIFCPFWVNWSWYNHVPSPLPYSYSNRVANNRVANQY